MRREKDYFTVIMFSKLADRQETNRKTWNIYDISKGQGWSSLNYHIPYNRLMGTISNFNRGVDTRQN